MHLLLVRHAQSANNAEREALGHRLGRTSDPELTELGHLQAARLGAALAADSGVPDRPVTRLLASPMRRTLVTAGHLAEALDLPIELAPDAFESGGPYDEDPVTGVRTGVAGATVADLLAAHPRLRHAGADEAWWPSRYEAEEGVRLERARRLLARLQERHADEPGVVVLVTHQHFQQYLVAAHLGLTGRPSAYVRMGNTATTLLITDAPPHGEGDIAWTNRVDHLEPGQRSGMWT